MHRHVADFNRNPHLQRRRLYRNFNNIRVRSFILTGAPINSNTYARTRYLGCEFG